MKIKFINNELALVNAGFKDYEYEDVNLHIVHKGFIKVIPNTFRFKYELFIPFAGEVVGFISGMYRGEDCLTFDQFIDRMKFRSPEAAFELSEFMNNLIKNKDIEVE